MYSTAIKTKDITMNRITNVRLHTPTVYEYQKVCDILVSLGIRPPGAYHSEYLFIYRENATISNSTNWFNNHTHAFMETSDYIKQKGLNKPQFLLKRKKL